MKSLNFIASALFLVASVPLSAEEGNSSYKPYIAIGPTFAQGDTRDLTQTTYNINNWSGEIGFEFFSPFANIHMRPNFGMAKAYGVEPPEHWEWPTYQMMAWYAGIDLVYKNPKGWPVNLTFGPSLHTWNVAQQFAMGDTEQPGQGVKLGWRAGIAYEVNEKWNVELSYTITEWKSWPPVQGEDPNWPENEPWKWQPGMNPSRPAYFSLKAFYHF